MENLIIAILTLWFVGLGFAVMARRPGGYFNFTVTRPLRWFWRNVVVRFFVWVWRSYNTQIIWFALGAVTTYYILTNYGAP